MEINNKYLFHYTSVGNLSLILKNKAIRFSRLDKVNDPEEAQAHDFPNAKYFIYVSCWTSEEKESLPLWNMYSSDMRGVRIRMPINMFKGRKYPKTQTTGFPVINIDNHQIKIKRDKYIYPALLTGPFKVEYSNNHLSGKECFTETQQNLFDINLWHIGLLKSEYWHFESEYRYRIIGLPMDGTWKKEDYQQFFKIPKTEYIQVPLDDSVLQELIVQLGPKATLSDSIIVELLIKEFASGAKVCDSSCKINNIL